MSVCKRIVTFVCVGVISCAALLLASPVSAEVAAMPWQNSYTGEAMTGDDVIGLWQFDAGQETLDSSGNGHTLTLLRGDSRFVPEGRFGTCLESFSAGKEGKAQGAVVKNHPNLSPEGAFSIELWIKPKAEMDQDKMAFLLDKKFYYYSKDIPAANFDYCLFMTRRGKDTYRITAGLGFGKDSVVSNSSEVVLKVGQWYHVAFTYDGNGAASFFLNGKLIGRTLHEGRGSIAPGKYDLLIGARYRGSHIGFPGYIDQVRISKGVVAFVPSAITLNILPGRTVFARMESPAKRKISLTNGTGRKLTNVNMYVSIGGVEQKIPLSIIPSPGKIVIVDVPVDTTVRPDSYSMKVTVSGSVAKKEFSAEQSTPVTIAPRPRSDTMPVVNWAWTNTDIKRMKEIGFTHVLDPNIIDNKKVWNAGQPTEAMKPDQVAKVLQRLDTHLAEGVGVLHYVYPGPRMGALDKNGKWLGKKYLRINREGDFYKSPNLCGLFPEARKFAHDAGASVAKTYWHHPAVQGALIHSERRDRTNPCFHEHDKIAFQKFAGFPIPKEVVDKNGVDYNRIKNFPKNRIVPDNDRILAYYRWFWKDGDGWNPLHSEVNKGLKSTGQDRKWTFFDPAVRAPAQWGSGGNVDVISNWTYSYPDPIKIGQATDELLAMAHGRPGQKVMKMTQTIWYRHQTAPTLPKEKEKWAEWEKNTPPPPAPGLPAGYITISPDHLREAFWSKISRPISGIMYHGWGSLVGDDTIYYYTNPKARIVLTELIRDVVRPLGPMLLQVPDRKSDVALLESFSSQMFAGRGTHGWGWSWEADMHLILQWAQIQPKIVYDETILRDGLSDIRVLVTPYCDVLTESVAKKIAKFQRRGGILVADQYLPPSLVPDIVIQRINRSGKADNDKAALQASAVDLRNQLDPLYNRYGDSSNPDIVVRFRQYRSTDYLFALNDKRTFGDYVGHHGLVMEKGLPASATLSVKRKKGYVYDLVRHKSVSVTRAGNELRFEADFGPGGGSLFMITSVAIDGIRVNAPKIARLGESIKIDLSVVDAQGKLIEGVLPVEVKVLDSQNRLAESSGYYAAKDGALSLQLDLAENDLIGNWTIHVKELASGKEARQQVTIQ